MRRFIPLILLVCATPACAEEKPALPAAWHGVWKGKLVVHGGDTKPTEVEMELAIAPVEKSDALTWTITYGIGDKASVRKYKLLPDAKIPGRFRIDEQNGIVLQARLVGRTLYSHFELDGTFLTARYELADAGLRLEITSAAKSPKKTGPKESVQSYAVESVQIAELKKAK